MPMENDCSVELSIELIYYDELSESAAFAILVNGEAVSTIYVGKENENVQRK